MLARTPVVPSFLTARRPGILPRAAAVACEYPSQHECEREMMRHVRVIHPHGSDGAYVLASKRGPYKEWSYRARDRIVQASVRYEDFVSMNRFQRRRLGSTLASVGHLWLEFDYYGEDAQGRPLPYRGMDPAAVMAIVLAAILAAGLPAPSYWTDSGRGLHAVWLCEALPGKAAAKVQRIMDELYGPTLNADGSVPARRLKDPDRDAQEARLTPMWRVFRDAGLDRQTRDSSRVLRMWGTWNVKAGRLCRRLWPAFIEDIQSHRVDLIADAVLPLTNVAYRQRMAEKAERAPIEAPANAKPLRARSANPYAGRMGAWERKLADLLRLREHRGRIAVGQRHLWTFLTANAYAQAKGGDPATWAELLAPLAGLTVADAIDCLKSLGRRQKRRDAGETVEHGGETWNTLFHYSGAKIADALGVTLEEADAAGLNIVRPGLGIAVPAIQRKAQKRIRDGAVPHAARADAKLLAGRQGFALQAEGKSKAEAIAAVMAVSGRGRTWAIEAMKLAAGIPAEASTETVVATLEPQTRPTRKSGIRPVRFSGRLIGGSAPAPSTLPAPPVAASLYAEPRVKRHSSISVEIEVAPGVGYLVIDDPKDRFNGRVVLTLTGEWTRLPEHLEPLAVPPPRKVRQPRPIRPFTRRRPIADAPRSSAARRPFTALDVAASAEAYRIASGR